MSLLIKGGHVVSPADGLDAVLDILTEDGKITRISAPGTLKEADRVIDAEGLTVMPGLTDLHTHLREPGQEGKETIESGTRAAAAGGYTAVACMPNTVPVNDSAMVTEFIISRAKKAGYARVYPLGAVSKACDGKELSEMGRIYAEGARGFSDDGRPVSDPNLMRMAMQYASQFGLKIYSHCEDLALVNGGVMNEGPTATHLGLRGITPAAEETMIARDIILSRTYGLPVHICHVSTAAGARMIAEAKAQGVRVTAETAPHYIFGTDALCEGYNTFAKVNPPLRREQDRAALVEALIRGDIDCIATDHAPHKDDDKNVEFDYAANGISGIEAAFSICHTVLVASGKTSLARLVELMSTVPNAILGTDGGHIREGAAADLAVADTDRVYKLDPASFLSKGKNNPFGGREVRGKIVLTVCGGRITYEEK